MFRLFSPCGNDGVKKETVFFLKSNGEVNNRIIKMNVSLCLSRSQVSNGIDPVEYWVQKNSLSPSIQKKGKYDFHAELGYGDFLDRSPIKYMVDSFNNILHDDYVFQEVGFCLMLGNKKDSSNGNIEIKFRPKGAAIVAGKNPDGMVVVNIHLYTGPRKHKNELNFFHKVSDLRKFVEKSSFLQTKAAKMCSFSPAQMLSSGKSSYQNAYLAQNKASKRAFKKYESFINSSLR